MLKTMKRNPQYPAGEPSTVKYEVPTRTNAGRGSNIEYTLDILELFPDANTALSA